MGLFGKKKTYDEESLKKLVQEARSLNDKDAIELLGRALKQDPKNARLWRIYGTWFEHTSPEAINAFKKALEIDPNSLDDHPHAPLYFRLSGKVFDKFNFLEHEILCLYCVHYSAGDVDRQMNWCKCSAGHRLLEPGDKSFSNWIDKSDGDGVAMFKRTDCVDWEFRGSRFWVQSQY